jgi:hypothetical protein
MSERALLVRDGHERFDRRMTTTRNDLSAGMSLQKSIAEIHCGGSDRRTLSGEGSRSAAE